MKRYNNFFQGLIFEPYLLLGSVEVFQVESSYLTGFPRGLNAASDTKKVFSVEMFVSSIYLLKKRAGKPNTHGTV